jgi:hypothetical protein
MNNAYHFHKDCKYYPQCTEEVIKDGKQKYVRFVCPALTQSLKYYPNDVHAIKISCSKFEPYQQSLVELIERSGKDE